MVCFRFQNVITRDYYKRLRPWTLVVFENPRAMMSGVGRLSVILLVEGQTTVVRRRVISTEAQKIIRSCLGTVHIAQKPKKIGMIPRYRECVRSKKRTTFVRGGKTWR